MQNCKSLIKCAASAASPTSKSGRHGQFYVLVGRTSGPSENPLFKQRQRPSQSILPVCQDASKSATRLIRTSL